MDPASPPHHNQLQEQEHDQVGCPTMKKEPGWAQAAARAVAGEARAQRGIVLPLIGMNLTGFVKQAITTAFLGRLGDLELAAGTLGFSFASATGIAVLMGLCGAMDPICGQAHGAGNAALLRRTLVMTIAMLLAASVPIALLWLRVDAVLHHVFGQQPDISAVARRYVVCLLPDLAVVSFRAPLKAYLSSQEVTLPAFFSSAVGLAVHVPLIVWLSRTRGVEGVATAVWLSDLATAVGLAAYVLLLSKKDNGIAEAPRCGRWWPDMARKEEWVRLLRLAVPCCLNTCLEWWCLEILILLTGRLPDARRAVAVIAVTLNFDYLLYAAMLSLSVSAAVRVSNSLGAGDAAAARRATTISIMGGILAGVGGGALMLASRRQWARLYTRGAGVRDGVAKAMTVMAALEVLNFPLNVCGGIVRGTARPAVGMYAVLGGFYLVALPVAVALGFRARLGIEGLLAGFIVGTAASLTVLVVVIARMDWKAEADKARVRAGVGAVGDDVPGSGKEDAPSGNAGEV
ncbi:hypothetical protein QYE76_002866 [Lolium multiflorum]|uniref:Protein DETOXIFICATION n=1 Tax=Lolium multiflorum TaxID=4521 RepID=A0AAD8RMJ3_LOLMU|nr:hypothetical protein QYE76_002866 [Lolium multiflorum]